MIASVEEGWLAAGGGLITEWQRELGALRITNAAVYMVDASRDGVHVEEPLVDDVPVRRVRREAQAGHGVQDPLALEGVS